MPHRCKTLLVDMLGLSESQVQVIAPDVGGGFGPKAVFHPEELAISAAAILLGVPLKWIEDRFENFLATVLERDQAWSVEVAAGADGRILGIRGEVHHDHGACTPYGLLVPHNAVLNVIGPYVIPAMDFRIAWCLTNKAPVAPTRGAGRPQGTFVIERILDIVAKRLGLDRAEVRRRNMIPAGRMPYALSIPGRDRRSPSPAICASASRDDRDKLLAAAAPAGLAALLLLPGRTGSLLIRRLELPARAGVANSRSSTMIISRDGRSLR